MLTTLLWQQYLFICEVNLYTVKCTYLKFTAWQMLTSRYRIFSPPNVGPLFPLLSTHPLPQAITILILSHWLVLPEFELHMNGIMYHTLLIHHTCIMNLLCLAYIAHYNVFDIYSYLYTHQYLNFVNGWMAFYSMNILQLILLLIDIWTVFSLGLLWIKLAWQFLHRNIPKNGIAVLQISVCLNSWGVATSVL